MAGLGQTSLVFENYADQMSEPVELTDALALLRADRDSTQRLLEADLKERGATAEEAAPWLDAHNEIYRQAATTLFRIDSGAPPRQLTPARQNPFHAFMGKLVAALLHIFCDGPQALSSPRQPPDTLDRL